MMKNVFTLSMRLICIALTLLIGKSFRDTSTLRLDVHFPFPDLSQLQYINLGSTAAAPLVYSTLCSINESGRPELDLLSDWEFDEEQNLWTLKIRNAKFHDGTRVTGEDVAFSLYKAVAYRANLGANIRSIMAGEHILLVGLYLPDPFFLNKLSSIDIFNQSSVGSGPYKIKHQTNDLLILSRNNEYYGAAPSIDSIEFHYVADKEHSIKRLIRDETDAVFDINAGSDVYSLKTSPKRFTYSKRKTRMLYAVLLNTQGKFKDGKLRQALASSIDFEALLKILPQKCIPISGLTGADSSYHHPDCRLSSYNPEAAASILSGFSFDLLVSSSEPDIRIGEFLKASLSKVGADIKVIATDAQTLPKSFVGRQDFDAVLTQMGAVLDTDPERWLSLWTPMYSEPAVIGGFEYPAIRFLASQIACEPNPEERKSLYKMVELELSRICPAIPLFETVSIDVSSKRVSKPIIFSRTSLKQIAKAHMDPQK